MLFIICYIQLFLIFIYKDKIMSKEMRNYIDKFREFINENYHDEYHKALKDINVLIPLISVDNLVLKLSDIVNEYSGK